MIGALGVVYGDIGTSLLYAMHISFFGPHPLGETRENVLGVLSMFFWALLLVIGVKYVLLVMRADNRGEGGIFALLSLINGGARRLAHRPLMMVWGLIILGAALLLAEGMITPAISVLSALEGLEVLAPALEHWVVPVTVGILLGLFAIQSHGTRRIGLVFGPIMLLWFTTVGATAIPHLFRHSEVFLAVNPLHAISFMRSHGMHTIFTLGAVVLCITGGEALYADMGHFGRGPIRRSWWCIVFPALILNYFGQGALLLDAGKFAGSHLFYAMVPPFLLVPMIVLATAATVIASQSLISGSFSLIQQAIALGSFPRQRIIHTNPDVEGQIYLPFVNWSLMCGCIVLVVAFKSSAALAAAYGIAVTGTMTITTVVFYIVARYIWRWRAIVAVPLCALFLTIDLTFFGSNLIKFGDGGYVPIFTALGLFAVMHSWHWGRGFIARSYQLLELSTVQNLIDMKRSPRTPLLDRSIVVLASRPVSAMTDTIPPALQSRLDHLGAIYRHITILSVIQHPGVKEIEESQRMLISVLQDDPLRGSIVTVQILYGYMQDPNLSRLLPELVQQGVIRTSGGARERSFTILSGAERIIIRELRMLDRLRLVLFRVLLRNANTVLKYFNLESFPDVSVEVITLGAGSPLRSWLAKGNAKGGAVVAPPVQPCAE